MSDTEPQFCINLHTGIVEGARFSPSPHFDGRDSETVDSKSTDSNRTNFNQIDLLVIHNISLPPRQFGGPYIDDFFAGELDPGEHPFFEEIAGVKVSSHLLIRRTGEVVQYVPLHKRAWHAGVSSFQGREKCNDFSIGIELEGADDIPFEEAQYQALAKITRLLLKAYPSMSQERIAGHSDIAPGRKTDPGPAFDWKRYYSLIDKPSEKGA